ncbi:MAG: hypothetical protein JWL64_413 [Frankiales bacterium]|nr:hypothetical protein [Frankiales bacterium]
MIGASHEPDPDSEKARHPPAPGLLPLMFAAATGSPPPAVKLFVPDLTPGVARLDSGAGARLLAAAAAELVVRHAGLDGQVAAG